MPTKYRLLITLTDRQLDLVDASAYRLRVSRNALIHAIISRGLTSFVENEKDILTYLPPRNRTGRPQTYTPLSFDPMNPPTTDGPPAPQPPSLPDSK